MPREQINFPAIQDVKNFDPTGAPIHGEAWRDPVLLVSWQANPDHEGHVQVALSNPQSYLKSAMGSAVTSDQDIELFTPVLNRDQLNRLIRVLRRARDQAYGRDE